jgi:hypothetical protein
MHYKGINTIETMTGDLVKHNLALILSLLGKRPVITNKKPAVHPGFKGNDIKLKGQEDDDNDKSPRNLKFLDQTEKLSKWIPTTSNVYGKNNQEIESKSD